MTFGKQDNLKCRVFECPGQSKFGFDLQWPGTFQGGVQVFTSSSRITSCKKSLEGCSATQEACVELRELFVPVLYSHSLFLHIINGFASKSTWKSVGGINLLHFSRIVVK